jgi:peptidyl-prolyl cis-trans isomerase B (cyclophilin B)
MKIIFFLFLILACSKNDRSPTGAIILLEQGDIEISFYFKQAPLTCSNFIKLIKDGFYNGTTFHRIEPGFVIQGGDLKSKNYSVYDDGTGELGYTISSESNIKHSIGVIAMAKKPKKLNPENRSNASQFYIALDSLPELDKDNYTVFAKVEKGFEVLNKLCALDYFYANNPNSNNKKITEMKIELIYK